MTASVMRAIALLGMPLGMALVAGAGQRYRFDAAGGPARFDQSWELRAAAGDTVDLLTSLARCESQMFVTDTQGHVYRVDAGASSATLRAFAGEEQGIGRPTALAADCDRGRLFVVNAGPRTVVTLDMRSGAVLKTQSFKRELYESRSARLVEPDVLYIGGLWNVDQARALTARDPATFFESTWIGEKLSLASGEVDRGLAPYETRCVAAGACTFADLDRIRAAGSAAWVASQGLSTRIALYDAAGTRTATYDVTSPKFLRDGTELPVATPPAVTERWKARNSLIRRVFAVKDYLVTIHALTDLGPDWTFGEQTPFLVWMNVHALDGAGLVSDVKLPDVPIGRDETHLYAIDYGAGGRRRGAERVTLVRIPITAGADAVR